MNLAEEQGRLALVLKMRDELNKRFDATMYNVFCFGSFLTSDFVVGKSDIDLGIYCIDAKQQLDIQQAIEDFLRKEQPDLSYHIVPVVCQDRRWVNHAILVEGVQFTDYFPSELQRYLWRLRRELREHQARLERRRWIIQNNAVLSVGKRTEELLQQISGK